MRLSKCHRAFRKVSTRLSHTEPARDYEPVQAAYMRWTDEREFLKQELHRTNEGFLFLHGKWEITKDLVWREHRTVNARCLQLYRTKPMPTGLVVNDYEAGRSDHWPRHYVTRCYHTVEAMFACLWIYSTLSTVAAPRYAR